MTTEQKIEAFLQSGRWFWARLCGYEWWNGRFWLVKPR